MLNKQAMALAERRIWNAMEGTRSIIKHYVSMFFAILSLSIWSVLTSLSHSQGPTGLFEHTQYNLSETFPMELSMDKWSMFIDMFVPFLNMNTVLATLVLVWKRNDFGTVWTNPEVHSAWFYWMWPIACLNDIGSLFLSDRGYILQAFWLKVLAALLTFYMLFSSYVSLQRHRPLLDVTNSRTFPAVCYLTQNSLALSAWWILLDVLVSLGVVLKYGAGLRDPLLTSGVFTLLLLAMLLWFALENFIWVEYIRYNFTTYPIIILGLSSIFTRGFQAVDMAPNTVYCGCLMLLATVMNCVFLFRLCCDQSKQSIAGHPLPPPRPESCPSVCLALDKKAKEGKWDIS